MKNIILTAMFATAALLFAGCSDENPYSGYHASFKFNSTFHPYNQVRTPGQYICVRRGRNHGEYKLTDALGKTTTVQVPEIDLQQGKFHYGLGGLIIGTPSAYGEGALIVYDWACPSCDLEKYRLNIDRDGGTGKATCPECGTEFDLNSGGVAVKKKSKPLRRYRVIDDGTTVIVQN